MTTSNTPASTLSASGRAPSLELAALTLVRDALRIPHAATVGGDEQRLRILNERAMIALVMVEKILDPTDTCPDDIRLTVFREMLADHPAAGYVTSEQAHALVAAGATWAEAVRPAEEGS